MHRCHLQPAMFGSFDPEQDRRRLVLCRHDALMMALRLRALSVRARCMEEHPGKIFKGIY
jgi:hypothetical protein